MSDNVSVSPFGQSSVSDRAYKRTERLALATYFVTNHVSENENLRKKLRGGVEGLLQCVLNKDLFQSADTVADALYNVRYILTLLDLAFVSHLISEINVNVLKKAYINFGEFLESSVGSEGANNADLGGIFTEDNDKITVLTKTKSASVSAQPAHINKSAPKAPPQEVVKNTPIKTKAISTNRRVVILDMVAKQGRLTVKDVSSQIPDASPKTLQRELMSLVNDGVLKKEGNKRWTVYTLVR